MNDPSRESNRPADAREAAPAGRLLYLSRVAHWPENGMALRTDPALQCRGEPRLSGPLVFRWTPTPDARTGCRRSSPSGAGPTIRTLVVVTGSKATRLNLSTAAPKVSPLFTSSPWAFLTGCQAAPSHHRSCQLSGTRQPPWPVSSYQ